MFSVEVDLPSYTHLVYMGSSDFVFLRMWHTTLGTRAYKLNVVDDKYEIALCSKFIGACMYLPEYRDVLTQGTDYFMKYADKAEPKYDCPVPYEGIALNGLDIITGKYDTLYSQTGNVMMLLRSDISHHWRVYVNEIHRDYRQFEETIDKVLLNIQYFSALSSIETPPKAETSSTWHVESYYNTLQFLESNAKRVTSAVHTALTTEKATFTPITGKVTGPRVRFAVTDRGMLYPSDTGDFYVTNEGYLDLGRYHSRVLRRSVNDTLWFDLSVVPMKVNSLMVNGVPYPEHVDGSRFSHRPRKGCKSLALKGEEGFTELITEVGSDDEESDSDEAFTLEMNGHWPHVDTPDMSDYAYPEYDAGGGYEYSYMDRPYYNDESFSENEGE